jgi:RNA polymerase sigma-70 factor (ECF subfamily)
MPVGSLIDFRTGHARLLDRLHRVAGATWPISPDRLAVALHRSADHHFADRTPRAPEVGRYLESLHVGDLALATACIDGAEAAWEQLVKAFRPALRAAARAIGGPQAQEMADSLFADLYGLDERDGRRQSLLRYFHGRSRLSTWLRAVLSQRYVDSLRAARRETPLDESDAGTRAAGSLPAGGPGPSVQPDPDRARYVSAMQRVLEQSLAALESRDRLRLSCYYVQDLTLAEIGRLVGEHEATVSRKLDRTRRRIRADVERALRIEHRLTEAEIRSCFEYAVGEWPFDLTGALSEKG